MAIGREASERGGVIDPVDVRGAGPMEWESVAGVGVDHPLVGGGQRDYNINDRWSRVITRSYSQAGPAADTISTPEGSPAPAIGHWSDVLNFHGSPLPWILVALIAIFFISHLKFRGGAGVGVGLG